MSLPESASRDSTDDFIHVQTIKADFGEERKKGTFFITIKADDGRTFKSGKYKEKEEINWAIEQKFSSTSRLSVCLVNRRFLRPNKKVIFPDFDMNELRASTTFTLLGSQKKVRVSIERKELGPFVEIIRRLLEESQQRLSNMKMFLEKLGKVCEVLNRISRCVEPMSDIHPAVSAAVSAVTLLYDVCKRQREVHEAATTLISDIYSFLLFTDLPNARLQSAIVERTASDILVLFEKVARSIINYSSETSLGALLADRMEEIDAYKEEFRKLKETLNWCIRVEIWKTALRIDTRTEQLILSQLHPVTNAFFDEGKSCSKNTRKKLLGKLEEWSSGNSGLFWLYGAAGSGKTAIAHTLAHFLHKNDRLAACFFWDKNDRDRRQAEKLLPTLAYQLAKWHADYRAEILEILESHDERAIHTGLASQFELLFRNPFNRLTQNKFSDSRPPRERHLVIVLDGLDESCDSVPARRALAGIVRDISTLVPWLKVFISSRRPPELEDCFGSDESNRLGLSYPPYDLRDEIKEFVARSTIEQQPDIQPSVSNRITNSSTVDALYLQFISNVVDRQRHDVDEIPLVRNILAVAACVALNATLSEDALIHFLQPLHPELAANAFHESFASLKPLLFANSECKLHLIFPVESFLGFLSNHSRSIWVSVDIDLIKIAIARRCLDTMRTHLRFNICGLESSYLENKSIPELEQRVTSSVPEFLRYSCSFWIDHVTTERDMRTLQDCLVDILYSPIILYWIEVLSLLPAPDTGKNILLKCRDLFQDNQKIVTAATELTTFLEEFQSAIRMSTPHIYVSALAWSVENPFIHEHLAAHFRCHFPLLLEDAAETIGIRDSFWVVRDAQRDWNPVRFANSVSHSPNKERIASGREDGTIRIWDAHTGTPIGSPRKGHKSFVRAVAYSPDSTKLISGSDDGALCIWDARSLEPLDEPFKVNAGYISAVQFSPSGKTVATVGAALRVWDSQSGETLGEPFSVTSGNKRYTINSLRYSADGSKIVLGCYDRTVRVCDASDCRQIGAPFRGHGGAVTAVSFSADGNRIASASESGDIILWDCSSGERICGPLTGHSTSVTSVEFSSDGEKIVTGSPDGTLMIWDACNGDRKEVVRRGEEFWDPHTHCYMAIPSWWPTLIAPTARSVLPSFRPEPGPLVMEDDGWVRTPEGHLILWVPLEYRPFLRHFSNSRSYEGSEQGRRLDWSCIYRGKSWPSIHEGRPSLY